MKVWKFSNVFHKRSHIRAVKGKKKKVTVRACVCVHVWVGESFHIAPCFFGRFVNACAKASRHRQERA